MRSCIRKVVMSKAIASAYLTKVSKASRTVTIYFNDSAVLEAFETRIGERYGDLMSSVRGFDYIVVTTSKEEVAEAVIEAAMEENLDYTDN